MPNRNGGGSPTRRGFLRAAGGAVAGVAAGGLWRPGGASGAVGGGHSGNLGAVTTQLRGTGLYIGNEFQNWSDATRQSVFSTIRSWGFDFVCPKVGGYGSTWFSSDAQLQTWKGYAHNVGLGFVPFIYSVPNSYSRDASICSELANDCGIVVVDMEDEWAGYNTAMANFGATFRKTNPNSPIIVTGYGDPITRFGSATAWPCAQMAYWADAYSPQWYYGDWTEYHNYGVQTAINWGDNQCATAFGSSFPMSPSPSIYSAYSSSGILPNADVQTGEDYAKNWKAPIIWWEYANMNASLAHYCIT